MTPQEIILQAEAAGARLRLESGRIRAMKGGLPDELKAAVKANRGEVMALLVEGMSLVEFAKAGLLVELGTPFGTVFLASDEDAARRAPEGAAVWTTNELRLVHNLTINDLECLSRLKGRIAGRLMTEEEKALLDAQPHVPALGSLSEGCREGSGGTGEGTAAMEMPPLGEDQAVLTEYEQILLDFRYTSG